MSKAQILDHVWHYDFGGDGGVVETYIGYLRRKLDTTEPKLITTIRGVGYTIRAGTVDRRAAVAARPRPRRDRRSSSSRSCVVAVIVTTTTRPTSSTRSTNASPWLALRQR